MMRRREPYPLYTQGVYIVVKYTNIALRDIAGKVSGRGPA
jgi:hypothetical protein